jgi:hypothetical protein
MLAAAIAVAWWEESPADDDTVAGAIRLRRVYWWSEEIARFREARIRAPRLYTRSRRKRRVNEATVVRLYGTYRGAQMPLQGAIKEAKRRAWDELLATLDSDPWGRPYRMVLNKLHPWAAPATESMVPRFL